MSFSTPITFGDTTSWIGFYGNYSGGIIGGFVAYIIAKYQIDRQQKVERQKEFINQLPALVKISSELEKIYTQFEWFYSRPKEKLETVLDIDQNLNKLNGSYWNDVGKIEDVNIQVELIQLKNFYDRLCDVFSTGNFVLNDFLIQQMDMKMNFLDEIQTDSVEDYFKWMHLLEEKTNLKGSTAFGRRRRKAWWDDFMETDYLLVTSNLQEKVHKLMTKIREVQHKNK